MLATAIDQTRKLNFAAKDFTMGLAGNLALATSTSLTDLYQYNLGFSDLNFRLLFTNPAEGTGFRDHLFVKSSGNPHNLATFIGFNDLNPFDGG